MGKFQKNISFEEVKYKIAMSFEVADAFLSYVVSKLSLASLMAILVGVLLLPGVIFFTFGGHQPSQVEEVLSEAMILSASGRYAEAVGVLATVKDKKMDDHLKTRVLSQMMKNQRLMNEGQVAGVKVANEVTKSPADKSLPSPQFIFDPQVLSGQLATSSATASSILVSAVEGVFDAPLNETVVKGVTPEAVGFAEKIEVLSKQGQISGDLYSAVKYEPAVRVDSDFDSVQVGLKYDFLGSEINDDNKRLILTDFYAIKALAEQDESLIDPDFHVLGLFVLTFYDQTGRARGDLQLVIMDENPVWDLWN